MKYIIVRAKIHGYLADIAVVFSDEFVHKDMARGACASLWETHRVQARVVGAGFYSLLRGEAWGRSESLNVVSRGEDDAAVIKQGKVFVEEAETAIIVDDSDWSGSEEHDPLKTGRLNHTQPENANRAPTPITPTRGAQLRNRFKGKR